MMPAARVICAAVLTGLFGCSGSPPHPHEESEPLLKVLTAYIEATRELKRPPMNELELRKHLPADEAEKALFSPRDNKLYVIRWNVDFYDPKLDPAHPPVVAYEQDGKDGVRHAITAMGLTQLSEEEFQKIPKD